MNADKTLTLKEGAYADGWSLFQGVVTALKPLAQSHRGIPWVRFDLVSNTGSTLRCTFFNDLAEEVAAVVHPGQTFTVLGRESVYRGKVGLIGHLLLDDQLKVMVGDQALLPQLTDIASANVGTIEHLKPFTTLESLKEIVQEVQRQGATDFSSVRAVVLSLNTLNVSVFLRRIDEYLEDRLISCCTALKIPGTPGLGGASKPVTLTDKSLN